MDHLVLDEVCYGNLGQGYYDTEKKRWIWRRQPSLSNRLRTIWRLHDIFGAQHIHLAEETKILRRPTRNVNINRFSHLLPEIVPVPFEISTDLQLSETIGSLDNSYTTEATDLIAWGHAGIYEVRSTGARNIPILASVTGSSRHMVRLSPLTLNLYKSKAYPDYNFLVNDVDTREPGYYVGRQAPIKQLCFSSHSDRTGCFLAVRTDSGITILRPTWRHRRASQVSRLHIDDLVCDPPRDISDIGAGYVLEVSNSHIEDRSPANVAFNPWYEKQFAIINTAGLVSTFTLDGPYRVTLSWKLEIGPNLMIGKPSEEEQEITEEASVQWDGWAALLWAGDEVTVIAATRRVFQLLALGDEHIDLLETPNILEQHVGDWILDIHRDPTDARQVYVLTSTHVVWLQILTSDEREAAGENCVSAKIMVRFCHHRSAHDISMRLSVHRRDEDVVLLVFSRVRAIIVAFTLKFYPGESLSGIVSDPVEFNLEEPPGLSKSVGSNMDETRGLPFTMLMTAVEVDDKRKDSKLEEVPMEQAETKIPNLIRILYVDQHLRLGSVICVENSDQSSTISVDIAYSRKPPGHLGRRFHAKAIDESFFIVPDKSTVRVQANSKSQLQLARQQPYDYYSGQNKVEWLARKVASRVRRHSEDSEQLNTVEAAWKSSILDGEKMAMFGARTLSEVLPSSISVDDIDQVSRVMVDFLDAVNQTATSMDERDDFEAQPNGFQVVPLTATNDLNPLRMSNAAETPLTVVSIYEDFLQTWVQTLPIDVPQKLRVLQEIAIRRESLRLFLGFYTIQERSEIAAHFDDHEAEASQGPEANLPVRKASQMSQSQTLADSESQTQPQSQSRKTPASLTFHALSKFCDFESHGTLPDSRMRKILDEWELGGDPSVVQRDDQVEVKLTRKQEKRKMRAEKANASQRSLALMAAPNVDISSQLIPNSQVMGAPPRPSGSQLGGFSQVTASQVTATQGSPGTQGTQSKKKKKPRREGFG